MEYKYLKDIAIIKMGQSPDSTSYNEEGQGIPFFQGNADFGETYPNERVWCTEPKKTAKEGDILISVRAPIGAINYAKGLCCIGRGLAAISVEDGAERRYIYHFLKTQKYDLNNKGTGSTFKAIGRKVLEEIQVPQLSGSEQQKFVDIIDSLETIIRKRKKQIEKFDNLIKARFVEMFRGIDTYCEVGHYIDSLTAGKSLAGEEECDNKVLKTGAASFNYFDASQVKNLPLDYDPQPEHRVQNGDVIISRMNTAELTGAAAYVWNVPENTYLPDRLWKAHMKEGVNPIFVWQALIQPETKEQIRRDASGTSGSMKNISKPGLLAIKVKKVPAKEQDIFAAFVKQVDKSKAVIQKSLDETQVLFDSMMQKYFG